MTHAEIIARATAEAERQGFELVAIHAVPSMGARSRYAWPRVTTPGLFTGLALSAMLSTMAAITPPGSAPLRSLANA